MRKTGFSRMLPLAVLAGLAVGDLALLAALFPHHRREPPQPLRVKVRSAARWEVLDGGGRVWDLTHLPPGAVVERADLRHLDWSDFPGFGEGWPRFVRCDFRGADFTMVDLHMVELSHCNVAGANLCTRLGGNDWRANEIRAANLRGATCYINARWPSGFDPHAHGVIIDYSGGDLRGADLRNRNLANANLAECSMEGADLRGADLTNACLDHTNLWRARLRGAKLRAATYNHWTTWPSGFNPIAHGARAARGAWW